MANLTLNQEDKTRTWGLILAGLIIFAGAPMMVSPGANSQQLESGTGSNAWLQGSDVSNTFNVVFPTPYLTKPILVCCPFTSTFAGIQPFGLTWSTVFVPQQVRNATNPTFDVSARHDQNNSTCSPCINRVTITPSMPNEVIIVHIFFISDVTITVTSVTSPGLSFTRSQPFGAGAGDEIAYVTSYVTSATVITVTFSAPSSTIVTTSVVATAFGSTLGVENIYSGSGTTSPITVADNSPAQQFSTIVGNTWLSDAAVACHDPTPGSGQTQILNANIFCLTNVNGATPFLYNYDAEYFKQGISTNYNYLTNFNGTTSTGLSINIQLAPNSFHDKLWSIGGSTTNSTLYNSDQYDTALNPPFQSQLGVSTFSGRFSFICNYATANVSLTMNLQANFAGFTNTFGFTAFTGNLCNGNLQVFNIQPGYALADNYIGRVIASCVCSSTLQISISNMFIGWRMLGQNVPRESIFAFTNTGFSVRWFSAFPSPSGSSVNWFWNATSA